MFEQPTQDVTGSRPVVTLVPNLAMNHNETVIPARPETPAPKQTGLARGLAMSNHNETVLAIGG